MSRQSLGLIFQVWWCILSGFVSLVHHLLWPSRPCLASPSTFVGACIGVSMGSCIVVLLRLAGLV